MGQPVQYTLSCGVCLHLLKMHWSNPLDGAVVARGDLSNHPIGGGVSAPSGSNLGVLCFSGQAQHKLKLVFSHRKLHIFCSG